MTGNMKQPKTTIRPFTTQLRKQGFEFCFCDRGGGCKVTEFSKRQGDRQLRVQFWGDGEHRVSHSTYSDLGNGIEGLRGATEPTDFTTVAEMLEAIAAEWTRPSGPGVAL